MSRKILGLDIRTETISAVLLDSGFKGSWVDKQGRFPISASPDSDDGIRAALSAVVETLKPAGSACVLGIPTQGVSIRNLSVPFHDIKKIRQILPFELEPSLPLPVDELVFDFEAVKQDGQQDILAFAIPKTRIQSYLELLETVHLRPVAIMPAGYAAARCAAAMAAEDEDLLLIDSGDGHHAVYAISGGHVRLARTLPVATGANPTRRNLESTLQRTFTAMEARQGVAIDPMTVFTSGPQADLLLTGNGTQTLLDRPLKTFDAIRRFPRLKGPLDTPEWQSGELDTALALAIMESESIGGVNFSTQRSTLQHYWSEYRSQMVMTAALLIITLAAVLASQYMAVTAKQGRVAELDRQIETVFKTTFPEVSVVVDPLAQMKIKITEAGDGSVGLDLTGDRVRVIDILNSLSVQIPKSVDIQVIRMVVGADNVMLSGNTDTFNTVDDIKGRLEKADIFSRVTISSADLEKSGKRVRFKLKLDY